MSNTTLPGRPADRGLQPERTTLAWRRSLIAVTVASLLVARTALVHSYPVAPMLWLMWLTSFICVAVCTLQQQQRLSHHRTKPLSPRSGAVMALGTSSLCISGAFTLLWR